MTDLKALNSKYHMFSEFSPEAIKESKFHFSAKDNLTSKDFQTRCGSMILDGYHPVFDATVISKLKGHGGELIGKTNMDEFGFGTFSTNSAFGVPRNPFDLERSCGGSSGGAACAASVIDDHVSLGVSTGGSICCPASFCGVYGIAPTYGRVSRYGLIDYGNSLDKIGLLSSKADALKEYLPIIAGKDPKDPTSCAQPAFELGNDKIESIAVPNEALTNVSDDVISSFKRSLETIKSMGIDVKFTDMPALRFAVPAYYVLATSEASTNLARYVGMRYGQQEGDLSLSFDEYFTYFRSKYFGTEAKRRVLLGTYTRMAGFRDRYYSKALQVRSYVINSYKKIFEDHDAILTPTMPFVSPRFDEISKMTPVESYSADFLTIPANISGMPHLSLPCGYNSDGMPIGMQMVTDHWMESPLLSFACEWDKTFDIRHPEVSL